MQGTVTAQPLDVGMAEGPAVDDAPGTGALEVVDVDDNVHVRAVKRAGVVVLVVEEPTTSSTKASAL